MSISLKIPARMFRLAVLILATAGTEQVLEMNFEVRLNW